MADDCREQIPDSTVMVRGIRDRDINRQAKKIRKGAFLPRRNGKDDDGLSVSQPLNDSLPQLMERMSREEPFFCKFLAGSARSIVVDSVQLDVCPKATQKDPFHALIKNVPTAIDKTAQATRFAELLAAASEVYDPPAE